MTTRALPRVVRPVPQRPPRARRDARRTCSTRSSSPPCATRRRARPCSRSRSAQEMIEESLAHLANVTVVSFSKLVVDVAKEVGADFIVKGLRAVSDFESEITQAQMNLAISGVHTLFIPSGVGQLVPRLQVHPRDRPLRRRRHRHGAGAGGQAAQGEVPADERRLRRRGRRSRRGRRRGRRRSAAAATGQRAAAGGRAAPQAGARHRRRRPPDAAVVVGDDQPRRGRSSCSRRPSTACPRSCAPPAGC